MALAKRDYRHGRILGAYLTPSWGGQKVRHPAVIISPDSAIVQPEQFDPRRGGENQIVVIGISSEYRKYKYPYVPLPFDDSNPRGHRETRLHSDVAAIIGWYHIITIDDDRCYWGGDVPAKQMAQINAAVRKDILRRLDEEAEDLGDLRDLMRM